MNFPLLIDGGLSNVLEAQGCDLNHKLWTAKLLDSNPEVIIHAHECYIKAGAQCITTASYQASVLGYMDIGYDKDQTEALLMKSVHLAERAIERAMISGIIKTKPFIAASIGPYGAYLADGSEYRGNYDVSDKTLYDFHFDRIMLLNRSNADLFACETIPSYQEAQILARILAKVDKLVWVSFSCKNERELNDGTPIEKAVALFKNHPKVFAIGANCTHPKYISGIIKCIKASIADKKIIVYPNSGEAYHAETKTWLGLSEPIPFAEMTKEWQALGADIIGGCCRIGPEHIRKISDYLDLGLFGRQVG